MTDDKRKMHQANAEDLAILRRIAGAYGGDPARWPAEHRTRLERLAPNTLDLEDDRALDLLLDESAAPVVPAGGAERAFAGIVGETAAAPAPRRLHRSLSRRIRDELAGVFGAAFRPAMAVMAASLVIGIYLGQADFVDVWLGAAGETAVLDDSLFGPTIDQAGMVEEG